MAGILGKLFGNGEENALRKIRPLLAKVNKLESEIQKLSLSELQAKTESLKSGLHEGGFLNDILPEAFALVREASLRTLGQRHFDVQILGGIVLHQGRIAEMRTGEGKTLVATLPAYLNALEGKGVHVVTVNDYLAKRDTVWMGQIYYALGLSVGCITHDSSYIYDPSWQGAEEARDKERDTVGGFKVVESYLKPVVRQEAYAADITYGTNNEFGFDYLRDNMAYDLGSQAQRGQHFAIIDEVDSILIDEARTPLIISAPDQESSDWYKDFSRIIPRLQAAEDYEKDEKLKAVSLTESGIDKVEHFLGLKDIYQEKGIKYLHHLEQALKAHVLFEKDKDYVVKPARNASHSDAGGDGQVIIVDEFTGRLLPGRRYSGGLHQALEAKEGVRIQPESLTLASISFQNYFRLYKKLAGMTGTAQTSAEEFFKVYGLEVMSIPTNKPMARKDLPDRVYQTEKAKFQALAQELASRHKKGQPVLVGTVSIQKNEYLSALLKTQGIPHEVLNAKAHEREGEIIAQAGRKGVVTIATNMAGRGVDIVLGGNPQDDPEDARRVQELGGLHVIGTERHEARRIDNQLRGRSGRQGDQGSSQFFLSLDDDLVRVFGGEKMKQMMQGFHIPEDQPIESRLISSAIESAQAKVEGFNFDARKHLLEYDDVLNRHREVMYKKRREILVKAQEGTLQPHIVAIVEKAGHSKEEYEKKEQELGQESMRQAEKFVCLRVIDSLWIEHLENMEELRDSVRLRAYGQQDPLVEYKNEGHKMFKSLLDGIDTLIAQSIFGVRVVPQQKVGLPAVAPSDSRVGKVGRNDPCPCNSGKKFKKCHGK